MKDEELKEPVLLDGITSGALGVDFMEEEQCLVKCSWHNTLILTGGAIWITGDNKYG